jgi:DedD protein
VVRADGDKVATVNTGAPPAFEAPEAAPKPAATQPAATPPAPPAAAKPQPAAPAATLAPASPPAPAASADGRFLVNLGVYADAGHASALVEKVKKLGYPAFAESTEFQGKAAQRVRVGPYPDRAAAENVRLKIKQADAKVPSSVVQGGDADKPAAGAATAEGSATRPAAAAPPAPAAPTPTLPANRAGAYVVQVGAFKSEEEANKVRDRLRNGGVAAFIDKSGDAEQTLWKVRAGPYADRGSADAAVAALKQKFQLPGIVKTQP